MGIAEAAWNLLGTRVWGRRLTSLSFSSLIHKMGFSVLVPRGLRRSADSQHSAWWLCDRWPLAQKTRLPMCIFIHLVPEASEAFLGSFAGDQTSGCSWGLGSALPVNQAGSTEHVAGAASAP